MPLNADGDPAALFLGDYHLPWGHACPWLMGRVKATDGPPTMSPEDMGTRLVSWSPTNLVLETTITESNYLAAASGHRGFAAEATPDLAHPHWLDVAYYSVQSSGPLPIGSTYQFSLPISPGQGQRFFRIRNCDYGYFLLTDPVPNPTNFATATPFRPTNTLYTPYTGPSAGPGPAMAASQGSSIQPTVPLAQALTSVRYSPAEATAALAKSSTQSSFVPPPDPAADGWEVDVDHNERVVAWRSKAARTAPGKARAKASTPAQLRASDPAKFYAPHASADRFIAQFGSLFTGASPRNGLLAQTDERDGLGMTHVRYRQYLEGVPVFGAEVVVHVDAAAKVTTANGLSAKDPGVSVAPTETIEQARDTALGLWRRQPGALSPGREVEAQLEVFCPRLFLCEATPEFSETDVVDALAPLNGPEDGAAPGLRSTGWVKSDYLTWRIRVAGADGEPDLTYFVDAHSGKPRWVISNRMRLTNRQIYDLHGATSSSAATLARSEGQPPSGVSDVDIAYDCFGNINDFYRNVFGREGANSMGGLNVADGGLKVYVNYAAAYFGSVLGGSQYLPPTIDSNTRIETTHEWLDDGSFAHEYTHGLEYFTHPPSGMTYQYQCGALMESTSNIIAEHFKKYRAGRNDWMITFTNYPHGSNEYLQGFNVVMSDPWMDVGIYAAYGDPRSLYDRNFSNCGNLGIDNGGVHANSYPISYAAYLLTGGAYFNNCTINAIGLEAVGAIWYRANSYYSASANFAEAYSDIQQAAADLYPSNVVTEVQKALQAVELNQPGRCTTTTPRALPPCAATACSAPDFTNPAVLGKCNYYTHEFWDFIMPLSNILIKFGSDGGNPPTATFKYYIVPDK